MQERLLILTRGYFTWLTLDLLPRRLKSHKYLYSVHAQNILQMHIEEKWDELIITVTSTTSLGRFKAETWRRSCLNFSFLSYLVLLMETVSSKC